MKHQDYQILMEKNLKNYMKNMKGKVEVRKLSKHRNFGQLFSSLKLKQEHHMVYKDACNKKSNQKNLGTKK